MIIGYEQNGNVYYDYNNKRRMLVSTNASFVSVTGNCIIYKQNGKIYKAEINQVGDIFRRGQIG